MNVVSSSDLWLFLASNGGLTAGRGDVEGALFPYVTVDRLYDSAGLTGPCTAVWVQTEGGATLWQPLAPHSPFVHPLERNLYKSIEGDRVWFEETHLGLGLVFRSGWSTADDHGFVRRCELENRGSRPLQIRLLDGLRNLLPPGIVPRLQNESSCLTDAYKTAELISGSSLAVYALSAGIVDRAIPLEVFRASVAWSAGLPAPEILLSDLQLGGFLAGRAVTTEHRKRGLRGAYFVASSFALAPSALQPWIIGADTGLTQAAVVARRQFLAAGDPTDRVVAATAAATRRLHQLVGAADGHQTGADETATAHHFANVLFNIMRGGVFVAGGRMPLRDFATLVQGRNPAVAARNADFLCALPATLGRGELLARLAARGDPQLERLGLEFLPLTFSRRHGDPSRPWNRFRIRVRDDHGAEVLHHEGNWRDIFQNWEALCLSFPEYFGTVVARFLNASTADGYNPYRITHAGVEWEVPDPDDPWVSIGYWGDHQVVYLLKLLEWAERFNPDLLAGWLRRELFSYAAVPYRIAGYDATRRRPRDTIEFDAAQHRRTAEEVARAGTDARLRRGPDGEVRQVSLTEKLLVLVLTRLTNFVAGGGLWMNTQRPEWNDANNALVGHGVSVVTLCYLRRLLQHCRSELLPALGAQPVPVSAGVAALAHDLLAALARHRALLAAPGVSDEARRTLLDALAGAGSGYRDRLYRDGLGAPTLVETAEIGRLFDLALQFVDHSIRANRRPDGLYHAYNLLEFGEQPATLRVTPLPLMLEGQVAVLSAGLLSPTEAVALLEALRHSALYRPDQHSYLLYPDRQLPGFLERNVLLPGQVAACPLLAALRDAGDSRLVLCDPAGVLRFHADLVNEAALDARLAALAAESRWSSTVAADAAQVRAVYEQVFNHRAYTGRSGSMFGYEGLGSIYWHMVAKLLLAVQENCVSAATAGDHAQGRLAAHYSDLRAGLGFNKTPEVYGAFPCDPYSHTPGHSGAQQPGMTGQVKEEILTRWGELGVTISRGCLEFSPTLLQATEFTTAPQVFRFVDVAGAEQALELPVGAVGFTFCGVPVVYRRSAGPARALVIATGGAARAVVGTKLDAATSQAIFTRAGTIERLEVALGETFTPVLPPRSCGLHGSDSPGAPRPRP